MSRHAPIPPEVVAEIRASAEPPVAIARRLGIDRKTVAKIRRGEIHRYNDETRKRALEEREAKVRAVFSFPIGTTHAAVALSVGISREAVRRVRIGTLWADVLPKMQRMDPGDADARCNACVHWESRGSHNDDDPGSRCALGIPEYATEGMTWARGCGAFSRIP